MRILAALVTCALTAFAFAPAASARPLLIPPKHLQLPLPAEEAYPGQWGPEYAYVAIDGDTVLASARRTVDTSGDTIVGVYVFERAGDGNWNYAGALVEGQQTPPLVHVNGNVATVGQFDSFQVYERTGGTWLLSATIDGSGWPVRVEEGSIFSRPHGTQGSQCAPAYREFRKVSGTWQQVATVGEERCGDAYTDINDGRAIIVGTQTSAPAPLYRRTNGTWPQVATFPRPVGVPTVNASLAYFSNGVIFRNTGGDTWVPSGTFVQPEIDLGGVSSAAPLLRGGNLLFQGGEGDYFQPSHDIDYNTFYETVRIYHPSANGALTYFARLNPDFGLWAWAASEDGRRVVGAAATNNFGFEPASQLYVFEIPDSHTFTFLQQDNFESGNFARWTPGAGQFAVARNGSTRVLRQSSLAGDAGATLTSIDWQDQAIEADLRPLEFSGSGRWFGLVARRTDAANYYYVTFRAPDIISLRRVQNGVVKELAFAHAPEPFALGRSYRVRLEAIGDQVAAFLEGQPRVWAKDTAHTHGHPGVAGYRARFETDNVTVSGGSRLLTLQDSMDTYFRSGAYSRGTGMGTWVQIAIDEEQDSFHSYLRQTDTAGDARVFSRTAITNQVVSARVQPQAWGMTAGTQDPWVGVAARVVDDRNYLYLTLRRSGQLSLRKVVNGAIQVIGTVPVPVSLQQWYDLRLEVIGNHIRGFVNGDVKFELDDPGIAGSGRSAVLMYKTSADLWSWTVYQP